MKVHQTLWTVAAALALAVTPIVVVQAEEARDERPALQQALDQLVAAGAAGALIEVRNEHGAWRGTSGVAELGESRPVPTSGRFRAGSVTKTFVAVVVLQLAAEGRLRLDDPVERWLPGAVPSGDRITIRQLLDHTSGLYNYTDDLPLRDPAQLLTIRFRTWNPWQLLELATGHPLLFEPGTQWRYSNTDDIVLGLVIERVTGRPYGDEIERRILRPLQLDATSVPGTSTGIRGPHAHGYLPVPADGSVDLVDITKFNPSAAWAAGEMISSTADLNRFFTALLRGRLLGPEQLQAMTSPVAPAEDYGLGLQLLSLPCGMAYGHEGDFPGYSTWSFSTGDAQRRVTLAITWGIAAPHEVATVLEEALCSAEAVGRMSLRPTTPDQG
jgi:D-alanyl-D-alanine carboxypeptidase